MPERSSKIFFKICPAHRREIIDEGVTFSDLGERVLHMKIVIKIKKETEERDVCPVRNRILDMHRTGQTGWPEKLKVQVDVNPKKKPYVTENGEAVTLAQKNGSA